MDDIVIVSAARTPVGSFNGAFGALPAHVLGTVAIQAAIERAGLEPAEVDEVILGQVLTAGAGQNPARQAARAAGIPDEQDRLRHQPGLRLRPARRGAGRAADPHRREPHRGRRRAGEHEPVAACRASARRAEDGRPGARRHHDQGRAVGRLQRLPHGQHGRERRQKPTRSPASSRTSSPLASQQKAGAAQKAGRFKDEIAPVTVKGRKGDVVVADDEYIRHDATARDDGRSCGRPSARTAR